MQSFGSCSTGKLCVELRAIASLMPVNFLCLVVLPGLVFKRSRAVINIYSQQSIN